MYHLPYLNQASFPSAIALMDTLVFSALGPERRSIYGQQRLFGTLGFMFFSLLGGVAFNHLDGIRTSFQYRAHSTLASFAIAVLAVLWVPSVKEVVDKVEKTNPENDDWTDDTDLTDENTDGPPQPEIHSSKQIIIKTVLLMCSILTFGILNGVWTGYYGLFLENTLGASQSQMGATLATATLCETVAMFFSGFLQRKMGYQTCLGITFIAYGVR